MTLDSPAPVDLDQAALAAERLVSSYRSWKRFPNSTGAQAITYAIVDFDTATNSESRTFEEMTASKFEIRAEGTLVSQLKQSISELLSVYYAIVSELNLQALIGSRELWSIVMPNDLLASISDLIDHLEEATKHYRQMAQYIPLDPINRGERKVSQASDSGDDLPSWDRKKRVVIFRGKPSPKIATQATSMEEIFERFQANGWPELIESPHTYGTDDVVRRINDKFSKNGVPLKFIAKAGSTQIEWQAIDESEIRSAEK